MRVGIDATGWANRRGPGRFTRGAVEGLVAFDRQTTYVMLAPPRHGPPLPPGADVLRLRGAAGAPQPAGASRPPTELARLARAASKAKLDAILFPSVHTWFPTAGAPTVVGVHDVIAATMPKLTMPSRRARVLWRCKETLAIRTAKRVFTVSQASRAAIAARWRLDAAQLAIVPEAASAVFRPRTPAQAEAHLHAAGLQPGEPFLLFAGGISPHKNLAVLLGAVALLHSQGRPGPRLVVVGDLDDEYFLSAAGAVRDRVSELGLSDRVLLPGFISDEALAALYSTATAVVNPSLAEGYGLPAVEAAACGAPLVLSDLPAHREALDGAALFVRPGDEAALAAALGRLVGDERMRAALGRRAAAAVQGLSWDATARSLRAVLASALP